MTLRTEVSPPKACLCFSGVLHHGRKVGVDGVNAHFSCQGRCSQFVHYKGGRLGLGPVTRIPASLSKDESDPSSPGPPWQQFRMDSSSIGDSRLLRFAAKPFGNLKFTSIEFAISGARNSAGSVVGGT